MRFVYIILINMIFIGCSSVSVDKLWQTHKQQADYRAKLLKTQQAILDMDYDNKIYIIATYINQFNKTKDNKERFIISLYDDSDSLQLQKDYFVQLSSLFPINIKRLNQNDKLLNNISFKTEWKKYYLVEFPVVDRDKLYLTFTNKNNVQVKLYFAKRAKYTIK